MPSRNQQDKTRLRTVAKLVREFFDSKEEAGLIRWRTRFKIGASNTAGFWGEIGGIGRGKPRAEVWLDRYTGRPERCFWFGFRSPRPEPVRRLFLRAPDYLKPVQTLTREHVERVAPQTWLLSDPLKRNKFLRPIFEDYRGEVAYFGMFDFTPSRGGRGDKIVAQRAAAFFADVLRQLPRREVALREAGIYPRIENRRVVRKHLDRERDSLLAVRCKQRDRYRCQVCGMRFEEVYGSIGREFAEAHHIVPLSRLNGPVRSTEDDLITVCANCHRMLHRMEGERRDMAKLRRLLRKHRR